MRKEDVKIGMKVRDIETGDVGIVTDLEVPQGTNRVWVEWTEAQSQYERNQVLHCDAREIEPVQEEFSQEDKGSFKINQKVKKVVTEVKEAESFTITLSLEAAHQFRALMGACTSDSSLQSETKELCEYLYRKDSEGLMTFLGTPLSIDFSKARKWTKI